MIFNITGCGGISDVESELNFEVIAYTTEEEMLAIVPSENTIGIVTNTPISLWAFSPEEPDPIVANMVWFATDITSNVEFNVLKDNIIKVYPIEVKQHIDGDWVSINAKCYMNGYWVDIVNHNILFDCGDNTPVTGGWTKSGNASITTQSDGSWLIRQTSGSDTWTYAYINNPIDLTKATKLNFTGSIPSGYARLCIWAIGADKRNEISSLNNVSNTTASIDVTTLSGSYQIGFKQYNTGNMATLYKLWLE